MSDALTLARAMEDEATAHGVDLLDVATIAACMADKNHKAPADMLARQCLMDTVAPEVWGRVADLLILWSKEVK